MKTKVIIRASDRTLAKARFNHRNLVINGDWRDWNGFCYDADSTDCDELLEELTHNSWKCDDTESFDHQITITIWNSLLVSDIDVFCEMVSRAGFGFYRSVRSDMKINISVSDQGEDVGYGGFVAEMLFAPDGRLIGIGGSE